MPAAIILTIEHFFNLEKNSTVQYLLLYKQKCLWLASFC